MGVTPLRLLVTSAALVVGAALMPAVVANAAPEQPATHTEQQIAAMTQAEARLDAAAQRVSDPDGRMLAGAVPEPPVWLLVLLAPILVGGVIGAGLTLRRLR